LYRSKSNFFKKEDEIKRKEREKEILKTASKETKLTKETKTINQYSKNIEETGEIIAEKQKNINTESIYREDWESILDKWIKEETNKKPTAKDGKEILEKLEKYSIARKDYTRLRFLRQKSTKENLTENEDNELRKLVEKFIEFKKEEVEMFKEFKAFRRFYEFNKRRWYYSVINSRKEKYPLLLAEKLAKLKAIDKNEKIRTKNFIFCYFCIISLSFNNIH
jgi:hypothetical protein